MVARVGRDPYLKLIEERYLALERIAQEKEATGEGVHEVLLYYHTPGGERIEVTGNVYRDEASGALIVEGETSDPLGDRGGNLCEAITYPQHTPFTLEILPVLPDESPRPKPGFIRES